MDVYMVVFKESYKFRKVFSKRFIYLSVACLELMIVVFISVMYCLCSGHAMPNYSIPTIIILIFFTDGAPYINTKCRENKEQVSLKNEYRLLRAIFRIGTVCLVNLKNNK